MIKRLKPKSEFTRNVLTLMTGTSIAQAIPIAISPILTRIYTPEDFGIVALYIAIVSIIAVVATGRYELAIMLPDKQNDAANIVVLSALIVLFISFLSLMVVFIFNDYITTLIGNPDISRWLYFIPLSVLSTGLYQSLIYWNSRQKTYKYEAMARIMQSGSTGGAQVGIGYVTGISGGLIIGNITGQIFGASVLLKTSWESFFNSNNIFNKDTIIKMARQYKKFPLFASGGALLDTAAVQVPIFILTRFFGIAATGIFSLTFKVLNLPMTLISSAISQVLFQRITVLHNNNPQSVFPFILKMFIFLAVMTTPLVLTMMLYGVELFSFVFGSNWAEAGDYAAILSIAVAVRFAVSPLSSVMALDHNIIKGVYWQVLYFCTITVTLVLAVSQKIEVFLMIFVLHEVILYTVYLFIILYSAKNVSVSGEMEFGNTK